MTGSSVLCVGVDPDIVRRLTTDRAEGANHTVTVAPGIGPAITSVAEARVDCVVVGDVPGVEHFLSYLQTTVPSVPTVTVGVGVGGSEVASTADHAGGRSNGRRDPAETVRRALDDVSAASGRTIEDGGVGKRRATGRNAPSGKERNVGERRAVSARAPPVPREPAWTVELDREGVVQSASRTAAVSLGVREERLLDRPIAEVVDDEEADALLGIVRASIDSGDVRSLRLRGRDAFRSATIVPLPGGRVQVVIEGDERSVDPGEMSDREDGGSTDHILESTPIGIYVVDESGRVVLANPRAGELLDVERGDDVGDVDGEFYDGAREPVAAEERPSTAVFETGSPVSDWSIRVESTVGASRWFSISAAPVFADDGSVERVVCVAEDVTSLRERERAWERQQSELNAVVEDLRRSNAELEQFAYVASHDMKEPLRMITSYLRLIERRYADELDRDAGTFIEYAVDGADRMRAMIGALLTYSKIGRSGATFEPVDCTDVVDGVLADLEVAIEETDAMVTVGDLPTVDGDPTQLRQLFQNLVSNAIEYAGESAPNVSITAGKQSGEWVFQVSDDGVGIPPERVDRVFDLFASDDERGGTGIGLATCEKIVNRHGGRIWVESVPGRGSNFFFSIPD